MRKKKGQISEKESRRENRVNEKEKEERKKCEGKDELEGKGKRTKKWSKPKREGL